MCILCVKLAHGKYSTCICMFSNLERGNSVTAAWRQMYYGILGWLKVSGKCDSVLPWLKPKMLFDMKRVLERMTSSADVVEDKEKLSP